MSTTVSPTATDPVASQPAMPTLQIENGGDTMSSWDDRAIGEALCDLHKNLDEVKYDLAMQTKDAKLLMQDCKAELKGNIADLESKFADYMLQEQRDRATKAETRIMFHEFLDEIRPRVNPTYNTCNPYGARGASPTCYND